jgi:hypothetical protein
MTSAPETPLPFVARGVIPAVLLPFDRHLSSNCRVKEKPAVTQLDLRSDHLDPV